MEVAAVARAWAPRGVSAASPRSCVRVALVPTLSATNLSDRTLRVRFRDDWETTEARCAGAAPRAFSVDVANRCSEPRTTLAPGTHELACAVFGSERRDHPEAAQVPAIPAAARELLAAEP